MSIAIATTSDIRIISTDAFCQAGRVARCRAAVTLVPSQCQIHIYAAPSSTRLVQEYGVWDNVLFGSDYPFTTVDSSLAGIRALNGMLDGTRLPRLNLDEIEAMLVRHTFELLGITPDALANVASDIH